MQKSYYAIIPANVRYDKELTANAKLLYGEITALCNEKGYCWATNSYFSELYGVSNKSISRWINQLTEKGHIHSVMFYKKSSKEVDQRRIYLGPSTEGRVDKNVHTYGQKCPGGVDRIVHTPMDKNVQDNNTSFNTTFNNTGEQRQQPYISNELDSNSKNETPVVVDAAFGEVVKFYEQNIGFMTPFVSQELGYMVDDLNAELTLLALKESVLANARNKVKYAQSILSSWKAQNFKTAADVENAEKRRTNKQNVDDRVARSNLPDEIDF